MVLIAGAGPVGLAAANVLADAGVAVTVLEAEPRLPENLRASTFQPPTLDMLATLGCTRPLIEMGRVAPRLQYRDRAGLAAVICKRADERELDRYERQRRPVALEYVNTITIANKRNLEAKDPEEHRRWKAEMTRTAADSRLAREYMLKTSMIASLRKYECV